MCLVSAATSTSQCNIGPTYLTGGHKERYLHCDVHVAAENKHKWPPFGSLDSFWIMRSQRSRRGDKGIFLITLRERRDVLCIKYFTEIQGSAHKLNGLPPALRSIEYDLRPGFNRYPLTRFRTNGCGNSLIP